MLRRAVLLVFLLCAASAFGKENGKLKASLKDDELAGDWIYEDVEAGFREAKKTGKPLLVSFSCVP